MESMFILSHRHEPDECGTAFAAWRGFESPLRRRATLASCPCELNGEQHLLWWRVEATTELDALALLPPWLAQRAEACRVSEVPIP